MQPDPAYFYYMQGGFPAPGATWWPQMPVYMTPHQMALFGHAPLPPPLPCDDVYHAGQAPPLPEGEPPRPPPLPPDSPAHQGSLQSSLNHQDSDDDSFNGNSNCDMFYDPRHRNYSPVQFYDNFYSMCCRKDRSPYRSATVSQIRQLSDFPSESTSPERDISPTEEVTPEISRSQGGETCTPDLKVITISPVASPKVAYNLSPLASPDRSPVRVTDEDCYISGSEFPGQGSGAMKKRCDTKQYTRPEVTSPKFGQTLRRKDTIPVVDLELELAKAGTSHSTGNEGESLEDSWSLEHREKSERRHIKRKSQFSESHESHRSFGKSPKGHRSDRGHRSQEGHTPDVEVSDETQQKRRHHKRHRKHSHRHSSPKKRALEEGEIWVESPRQDDVVIVDAQPAVIDLTDSPELHQREQSGALSPSITQDLTGCSLNTPSPPGARNTPSPTVRYTPTPPKPNINPLLFQRHTPTPPDKRKTPPTSDGRHTPTPPDRRHTPTLPDRRKTPTPPDRRKTPPTSDWRHTPTPPDRRHTPTPPDKRKTPTTSDGRHTPTPPDRRHTPTPPDRKKTPANWKQTPPQKQVSVESYPSSSGKNQNSRSNADSSNTRHLGQTQNVERSPTPPTSGNHQYWQEKPKKYAPSQTPHSESSGSTNPAKQGRGRRKNKEAWRTLRQRPWEQTEWGQKKLATSGSLRANKTFTVASYNVLSQDLLEMHPHLYPHWNRHVLSWQYRSHNLLEEILQHSPDVLCMQEVHNVHFNTFFRPKLHAKGYVGMYKQRTGDKEDGCATFFKKSRFKLEEAVPLEYRKGGNLDRDNVALIVKLTPIKSNGKPAKNLRVVVANTHLLFNTKRGDIKLAQLMMMLAEVDRLACHDDPNNQTADKPRYHPVIMCGDYNSEPFGPLYRLMVEGKMRYEGMPRAAVSGQSEGGYFGQIIGRELIPRWLGITDQCQYIGQVAERLRKDRLKEAAKRLREQKLALKSARDEAVTSQEEGEVSESDADQNVNSDVTESEATMSDGGHVKSAMMSAEGASDSDCPEVDKENTVESLTDPVSEPSNETTPGPSSNDSNPGPSSNETLSGPSSNDTLTGPSSNDTLPGPSSNDTLPGHSSNDTLPGPSSNDTLPGPSSNDTLPGPSSNDTLPGPSSNNTLPGPSSNDSIKGPSSNDSIKGPSSNDSIKGPSSNDTLPGPSSNNTLPGPSSNDSIKGPSLNDSIPGPSKDSHIMPPLQDIIAGSPSCARPSSIQNETSTEDLYTQGGGTLSHKLQLCSVYSHYRKYHGHFESEVTSHHNFCKATLDYIFYGVRSKEVKYRNGQMVMTHVKEKKLKLVSKLGLPIESEIKKAGLLPNEAVSSDHVILIAKFCIQDL